MKAGNIFVLPKSMTFRLGHILDESLAYTTIAMTTKSEFYFEFKTMLPMPSLHQ